METSIPTIHFQDASCSFQGPGYLSFSNSTPKFKYLVMWSFWWAPVDRKNKIYIYIVAPFSAVRPLQGTKFSHDFCLSSPMSQMECRRICLLTVGWLVCHSNSKNILSAVVGWWWLKRTARQNFLTCKNKRRNNVHPLLPPFPR